MKSKLIIFSNFEKNNIFYKLFPDYDLLLKPSKEISNEIYKDEMVLILLNKESLKEIQIQKINKEYIIITNADKKNLDLPNKILFINTPLQLNSFKSQINNLLFHKKINFNFLELTNKKILNKKNNLFCLLTDFEYQILETLLKKKDINKKFVKENILYIKNDIETNSLESHLTRIRKKLDKLNANIKIISKKDSIILTISWKF